MGIIINSLEFKYYDVTTLENKHTYFHFIGKNIYYDVYFKKEHYLSGEYFIDNKRIGQKEALKIIKKFYNNRNKN